MSSLPAERSPFDDISHPAVVPTEMTPRITVRDINTAEPGPYYVFIPGIDAEGLKDMLHSIDYARIPAGEVFKIGAIEESMLAGRLDAAVPHKEITIMHAIEQKKLDTLHVIAIPASTTLQALKSDAAITRHVLAHIESFDKMDVEYRAFNELIRPAVILELSRPADWRKEIEAVGMLNIRLHWLQEAQEKLETLHILESHRRIIDARPFLRDLWQKAIANVLIPSIDQFRIVAETKLAAVEEQMRNPQNSATYDRYSFKLMWLLGRQPERSALSRTLGDAGKGGLSSDEIKMYVATEVAKITGATSIPSGAAKETMQCTDCGEDIRTIAGGPPRKCRHCGFEFRRDTSSDFTTGGIPVELTASMIPGVATRTARSILGSDKIVDILPEEPSGVQAAAELDKAAPIGATVAGELSAEDEKEIADQVARLTKSDTNPIDDLATLAMRGTTKS